jgi:hypothetical protein
MAIVRLSLANPNADTDTLLHTATRQSLVSVIATNTASATAEVGVWVVPDGATSASAYAYMAKDTILPGNNSLETFRFALETDDEIYVRSSTSNVSFSINAIHESSGNQNIVTVSASAPVGPNIGDVWVDTDAVQVNFWDGADWTSAVGGAAGYPQPNEPVSPAPTTGTMWLDTDGISDDYPSYPTVIYSPTDPSESASLTIADVGTIWVDEDAATMLETVVPAVLYQSTAPSGLSTTEAGYLWVDEDADVIQYNMNEYARNDEIINPFMLAGM